MDIYHNNLDNDGRLGYQFDSHSSRNPYFGLPNEDFFFVVHPVINSDEYEKYIDTTLKNGHCKGILFVSGSARCGLDLQNVNALENKYKDIHFLSYAVEKGSGLPLGYEDRFNEFFSKIESENIIDWDLIDPAYPESIVAALLLLQAAPLCSEPENWQGIWNNAVAEYNSRNEENLDRKLDWDDKEKIQKQIENLKKFLSGRQA